MTGHHRNQLIWQFFCSSDSANGARFLLTMGTNQQCAAAVADMITLLAAHKEAGA